MIASAAILAAGTQLAGAVATLSIFDGTTTITVTDGGIGDSNPTVGAVTWIGTIGVWNVNVSTGITGPVTSPPYPHLDLNSVDTSTGAGTLTLKWSDPGNGPSTDSMNMNVGGTQPATGSLTYKLYGDAGNVALATTTLLGTQGTFIGASYSQTGNSSLGLGGLGSLFSLTQQVVLTHSGAGTTSFDAEAQVPDGGTTLALLGSSMLGLGAIRRKFAKA